MVFAEREISSVANFGYMEVRKSFTELVVFKQNLEVVNSLLECNSRVKVCSQPGANNF